MAKMKNINKNWLDVSKVVPVTKTDHILRKNEGLKYGDDSYQQMDIYLPPTGKGPFPVIVNVHGGGMMSGDKHDWHLYPTLYALERGFAVAAVNYRLSPTVKYPTQVFDVKKALLWLKQNGTDYGVDKNNIFLWGTSAGGNLVLMNSLKKGIEKDGDSIAAQDIPIRAVAALCPEIEINNLGGYGKLWERLYLALISIGHYQKVFGKKHVSEDEFRKTNPSSYIQDGIAPLYIQHGDNDFAVPVSQTIHFGKLVKPVLNEDDLVVDILPGVSHAGNGSDFLMPERILPILKFFEKYIVIQGEA